MVAPKNLALFEAVGDQDVGFQPGRRGVGRDAAGQVARRGAADGPEAQLDGLRERDGDDAILERERRVIDGVVLDVELGARRAPWPGGRPGSGACRRRGGRPWARRRRAEARDSATSFAAARRSPAGSWFAADGLVVVNDFERAEILGAEIEGFLGVQLAAEATLQAADSSSDTGDSPDIAGTRIRGSAQGRCAVAFQSGR